MNNEITIKSLADELGVSKPTISKEIKRLGIEPKMILQKYILTEEEAEAIRNSILGITTENDTPKKSQKETEKTANIPENNGNTENIETEIPKNSQTSPQIIEILERSITILQKQLEIKDKQIESLTAQIETLTLLLNQQQQLTAMDKIKSIPQTVEAEETEAEAQPQTREAEKKKRKKSFFNLFG